MTDLNNKLSMTKEVLEDLVSFTGGNPNKIVKWLNAQADREITSIEDLVPYPLKNDYSSLVDKKEAPHFYKFFVDLCFKEWDEYNRHETLLLEDVLETLDTTECELDGLETNKLSLDYILAILSEFDKDIDMYLDSPELDYQELREETREIIKNIKQELIDLRFGSMCFDW